MGNAVKYTLKGKVKVSAEYASDLCQLRFEVRDTGKGISNLEATGHFFGNLDVIESVNQNGMGFGLKVSKDLTKSLGGNLIIQNIYHGGHSNIKSVKKSTFSQ